MGPYEVPWLARLLHSFPHYDLSLKPVKPVFDPESPNYRESLLSWAAVPVLWLLLTLFTFLVYFCFRCCQKEPEKRGRGSCLPWSLAVLALLTCAAVGVGFYGNEDAHKGLGQFTRAGEDADDTIHNMQRQIQNLQRTINNTIDERLKALKQIWRRHKDINKTVKSQLRELTDFTMRNASKIFTSVDGINQRAESIDISHTLKSTRDYEYWRWLGLILLLCWEIMLCLLLLLGIGRSSKCTLLMFCAFGIFTMVLSWISAGIHMGVSVGLGDFCVNPDEYLEKVGTKDMDNAIVKYYIRCTSDVRNPFKNSLKSALDSVTIANNTINKLEKTAGEIIPRSQFQPYITDVRKALDKTVEDIQQLTALVECTNLHKDYTDAIRGICYLALPGVVFILLSAAVVGLLLTIMVLMASCAWRNFGRSKGYLEVDEDDPFLPRPDNGSPSYYSFTRGHHRTNPRDHMPMQHRRSSPPPAKNGNVAVVQPEPSAPLLHVEGSV